MKYFTPELYARGNSSDEKELEGIEEEWEQALQRYERRWKRIQTVLPSGVRRLEESGVCLHDAEVLHLAQEQDCFVMVLRLDSPPRDLMILTFTLTQAPVIRTDALPDAPRAPRTVWLYEEFDVDRRGHCSFEVLLSNGWLVQLHFRDLQFLIAQIVFPARNGQADRAPAEAVRT